MRDGALRPSSEHDGRDPTSRRVDHDLRPWMTKAANDNTGMKAAIPPERACPICGKPANPDMRPFCSKRCADIDLHRWLGEGYRLPAGEEVGDEGPETI